MVTQRNTTEEFTYYHYDNFVLLAKKGEKEENRDIYHYVHHEEKWYRFYPGKKRGDSALWGTYWSAINFRSDAISSEELEERGIPLVEDDGRDITTEMFKEAENEG